MIKRIFGLVKENGCRIKMGKFYKGIDNVTIHTIEHDIVLTHDIIFDYVKTGKISPSCWILIINRLNHCSLRKLYLLVI